MRRTQEAHFEYLENNPKISNNFQEAMYEQISGKKAKEYWNTHKRRFGEGSIEDVDLQATGDAMKTMTMPSASAALAFRNGGDGAKKSVYDARTFHPTASPFRWPMVP
jgi:hypothetical protein